MSAIYAATRSSAEPRLFVFHKTAVAVAAAALPAVTAAAGFAASSLLPHAHAEHHTTFLTP